MSNLGDALQHEVRHSRLLRLYFEAASRMGDKSPFGAMLDRADLYGSQNARRVCARCNGEGYDKPAVKRWITQRAVYEARMREQGFADWVAFETLSPYPSHDCPRCLGTGDVPGKTPLDLVSVRVTAEAIASPDNTEPSSQAQQAARATRIMMLIGRESRALQSVLLAYYGARGEYCRTTHGIGDALVAVIPLTASGAKWRAKHAPRRGWQRVSRLLGGLARGRPEERAQYSIMAEEALRLLGLARAAWERHCETG